MSIVTDPDIARYRNKGYIVVPDLLSPAELGEIREELAGLLSRAGQVSHSDAIYDLGPAHTPERVDVRRIKTPHAVMPSVKRLISHPGMVDVLIHLIGPNIRFQTSKLNIKAAGDGAAVEWHQDWAFYPHTNDDLLAVGIMLDDMTLENGPLQFLPGSHKGPVYDHHAKGFFCGAIDPIKSGLGFENAESITGRAGSMSFHHVRAVHGSAPNRSQFSRNFLLFQFTAADAFPLVQTVSDLAAYDRWIIAGEPTIEPRVTAVPVRMPLPPAPDQGSIYANQSNADNRFFE